MTQPAMTNDNGVILTIGMTVGSNRCAVVIPLATDAPDLTALDLCQRCVQGFQSNVLNDFLAIFSVDCSVAFIQGEGMVDGKVPYRVDFTLGDNPGGEGSGFIPSNSGLLLCFYEEPADVTPGSRLRSGHNTIPGIFKDDFNDGVATPGLVSLGFTFGTELVDGFDADAPAGGKFYRVLASPGRTAGTNCKRVGNFVVRGYPGTQRRRLVPH